MEEKDNPLVTVHTPELIKLWCGICQRTQKPNCERCPYVQNGKVINVNGYKAHIKKCITDATIQDALNLF